ncbi:aldo/keto reductase [Russula earlei]|uniref:Aldo/keto reductase n=1 Tax=Russula earlei TaxID=71964 RepID=A0ACC0U1Y8_9AGAM|nr:aldo/keto reductase [Russula earlei]
MTHKTARLGGATSDVVLAKVGHGLMMMTWKPTPVPDEEAFAAIKAGIDALPPGAKMFLNSGEFYGQGLTTANLELVARFFEKHPEYAERTFLSVKGGLRPGQIVTDGSRENLRRSVDDILKALRGTKKLDLFQPARRDQNFEIEHYAEVLNELVKEGKFDYIGLSEVGAETIRRAHKIAPVAAVEIEVSLQAYERQTKDVIATCKELGITLIAYSPLGRGLLTGHIKSAQDFEEGDFRRNYSRFQDANIGHNLQLVDGLSAVANRKGITVAQLSIAWVGALGDHVIPLPGSSNVKRTLENLQAGDVELTAEDLAEISELLEKYPRKGARYVDGLTEQQLHLWG